MPTPCKNAYEPMPTGVGFCLTLKKHWQTMAAMVCLFAASACLKCGQGMGKACTFYADTAVKQTAPKALERLRQSR